MHTPVGPITRARTKRFKEALNGLVQEIWADVKVANSKMGPKEDQCLINLIKVIDGPDSG